MVNNIEIGPDGTPIINKPVDTVTSGFITSVKEDKPKESDSANLEVLKKTASDFNAKLNDAMDLIPKMHPSSVDDGLKATDNLNTAILDRSLPELRKELRAESDARVHTDRFNKLERIKSVCNQHSSDSRSAQQAYDMIRIILNW